ncbi:hypothetical protein VP01_1756g4 [Puccinia sorghi]|uniref:Uncharacterized protein n=1 Tax=Puccinia sorghi TaxID=27349 RepID=A0A0L6VFM1_9BASI|nr:hypothetical protein VP01_1756g4 [Puccinia sorghi]
MRKHYLECQLLIQDLLVTLVFLDYEVTNTSLLDTHLNVPSIPSLGLIVSPKNSSQKLFLDSILENAAEISDLLQHILSKWSLNDHPAPRTREDKQLGRQNLDSSSSLTKSVPIQYPIVTMALLWERIFPQPQCQTKNHYSNQSKVDSSNQ